MSLFKFEERTEQTRGAQNIVPNGTTNETGKSKSKVVNVVNDYAWTIQPKSARKDVPYLYMIERKLTNDVMVQQFLYNLEAGVEAGAVITEDFLKMVVDMLPSDASSEQEREEKRTEYKNNISKNIKGMSSGFDTENPYSGLYNLEDTGWAYVLPYFDKGNHNIDGDWNLPQDSDSGGIISKLAATASDTIGNVATNINRITSALGAVGGSTEYSKPGTYIEKAKQYNFKSQGPSYSLSFNLYNTGKITDVIDNWELCFALMYNLLPNRKTKTVFDPPPLYEVYIPGVRRSPVSFIKGMRVDFLGATRIMDLSVAGQDKLRTIVPDAYSIQIDIEDVLPESKNFMQSMIDEDQLVKVSTLKSEFDPTPAESVEKNANNITHITLNPTQRNGTNTEVTNTPSGLETLVEPAKRAYRSIQRTVKDINKIVRGRF